MKKENIWNFKTRARTIQAQTVTRARILLLRADAISIDSIADKVYLNRIIKSKKFRPQTLRRRTRQTK